MVSCPRPAWAFFVIFFLLHRFARSFSNPSPVFLWHRGRFVAICAFSHAFPSHLKTLLPWFPLFSCESFHFLLHPVAAAGNLSRPIPSRMARNNSLGTATSAIWKTTFWEWHTTFAPILISFSRNVVNDQCRTALGNTACRRKLPMLYASTNNWRRTWLSTKSWQEIRANMKLLDWDGLLR